MEKLLLQIGHGITQKIQATSMKQTKQMNNCFIAPWAGKVCLNLPRATDFIAQPKSETICQREKYWWGREYVWIDITETYYNGCIREGHERGYVKGLYASW